MNRIVLLIPKFRKELFGFSIITIIFFHFFEDVSQLGDGSPFFGAANVYNTVFGSVGVEIFIFLSGMGLFYSLSKNSNIINFYKRRASRVLPAYIIIGGLGWIVLDLVVLKCGFLQFLSDFSTVSFWTQGKRLVWYISFILIMYLVYPLIFKLLNVNSRAKSNILISVLISAVIIFNIALSFLTPYFYDNTEVALWRTVIFLIGAWFGKALYKIEKLTYEFYLLIALSVAFMVLTNISGANPGFLWGIFDLRFQMTFYPFIIIIAATGFISLFDGRLINRGLSWLGGISLELYLSHVMLRAVFNSLGLHTYIIWNYLIVIAASFAVSIGVKFLLKKSPLISKKKKPGACEQVQ